MRQAYQTLIIPYVFKKGKPMFFIFKRKDFKIWQFVSGGGEDNETPEDTASRELCEEVGVCVPKKRFVRLSSITTIPAEFVGGVRWGKNVIMIPEIAFAIEVESKLQLGEEHSQHKLVTYYEAVSMLKYDSNKSALWELNYRLKNKTTCSRNREHIIRTIR